MKLPTEELLWVHSVEYIVWYDSLVVGALCMTWIVDGCEGLVR